MKTNVKILEQLLSTYKIFWATFWKIWSNFLKTLEHPVDNPKDDSQLGRRYTLYYIITTA